jgi:hypothetical protein
MHHIIVKGIKRRKIFFDDSDRDDFLDRKSTIRSLGYELDWLLDHVLGLFGLTFKELVTGGKQRRTVLARSVLYYWGTRELGMSAVEISKKLNIASSAASESATRGRQILEKQGLKFLVEDIE